MDNTNYYNYCVKKGEKGIPYLKVKCVGFERHKGTVTNIINYKEIEDFIEEYGSEKDLNSYCVSRSYKVNNKKCELKVRIGFHNTEIYVEDYLVVENRETAGNRKNSENKIWLYSKDEFEKKYGVVE